MLVARINEKKAELENLKQLRDLSGGLAAQMQALEEKLSTLSDGTEGSRRETTRISLDTDCHSISCGSSAVQLAQRPTGHQYGVEYVLRSLRFGIMCTDLGF